MTPVVPDPATIDEESAIVAVQKDGRICASEGRTVPEPGEVIAQPSFDKCVAETRDRIDDPSVTRDEPGGNGAQDHRFRVKVMDEGWRHAAIQRDEKSESREIVQRREAASVEAYGLDHDPPTLQLERVLVLGSSCNNSPAVREKLVDQEQSGTAESVCTIRHEYRGSFFLGLGHFMSGRVGTEELTRWNCE